MANNSDYSTVDNWTLGLTGKVITTFIFGIVILTGIIGNILVITLIATVRKLHSVVNLCLSSLALADLTVLVFLSIMPLSVLYELEHSGLGRNFCTFLMSIDRGATLFSMLIFLLIGVERYTVLCNPLKSIGIWTYKKVFLLLAIIGTIAIGVSVPYGNIARYEEVFFNNETVAYCFWEYWAPWLRDYETALFVVTFFLPIPVLIVLYGKMISALKAQVPQSDNQGTAVKATKKSRSQVIYMLIILLTLFILCLMPMKLYVLVDYYHPDVTDDIDNLSTFILQWTCRIIAYINHASNPIVYFVMSDNFKEAFRAVFCKTFSKVGKRANKHSARRT